MDATSVGGPAFRPADPVPTEAYDGPVGTPGEAMKLRLHWTPNPPREPFEWTPPTVAQARLALHVINELESFIDGEPIAGKVTASWGGVEATTDHGWVDVEEAVPDWHEPDLGRRLVLDSEKAEQIAREVGGAYATYLDDQGVISGGRSGLVTRFVEAHTPR